MAEKTSPGKLVAGAGGLLLIISLFLKWMGADLGGLSSGLSEMAEQMGQAFGGAGQDAFGGAQESLSKASGANAFKMFGWLPFVYLIAGLLALLPAVLDIFDLEIELPFEANLVTLAAGLVVFGGMLMMLDGIEGAKLGFWLALLSSIAITVGGLIQSAEDGSDGSLAAIGAAIPGLPQQPGAPGGAPPAPPAGAPPAPPAGAPPVPPAGAPPVAPPPAAPPAGAPPAVPPAAAPPATPPAAPPPGAPPGPPRPPGA